MIAITVEEEVPCQPYYQTVMKDGQVHYDLAIVSLARQILVYIIHLHYT